MSEGLRLIVYSVDGSNTQETDIESLNRLICDAVHDFISINACRIFIKIVIVGNKLRKRYSMISPEMP